MEELALVIKALQEQIDASGPGAGVPIESIFKVYPDEIVLGPGDFATLLSKFFDAGLTIDINVHMCIEATTNSIDMTWGIYNLSDNTDGVIEKIYVESATPGDTICTSLNFKTNTQTGGVYFVRLRGSRNRKGTVNILAKTVSVEYKTYGADYPATTSFETKLK